MLWSQWTALNSRVLSCKRFLAPSLTAASRPFPGALACLQDTTTTARRRSRVRRKRRATTCRCWWLAPPAFPGGRSPLRWVQLFLVCNFTRSGSNDADDWMLLTLAGNYPPLISLHQQRARWNVKPLVGKQKITPLGFRVKTLLFFTSFKSKCPAV